MANDNTQFALWASEEVELVVRLVVVGSFTVTASATSGSGLADLDGACIRLLLLDLL